MPLGKTHHWMEPAKAASKMIDSNSVNSIEQVLSINMANNTQITIHAQGLTKVFGDRKVVNDLSFMVYSGELYALLGDNGAGKTTSINMLTTLLSPTEGKFSICGHDGIKDSEAAKSCFGVVSQDVAIYQELTAYENLQFVASLYGIPRQVASERIALLLSQAGLLDRAHDKAGEFSMGMQRKLSIAIAILHQPRVLFMDEPTVGLDPASRRQIWATLKELRTHGVTILLTTHYLEEAELLADRIGIIRKGALVIEGTIAELRQKIERVRGIAVSLSLNIDATELKSKIDAFALRVPTKVHYDHLRNTIWFAQPKESQLTQYLKTILNWLEDEKIPFSKFFTSEPSLEEVFLAITGTKSEVESFETDQESIGSELEGA